MTDNYYPYKKARHWHLKVELIPHSKLPYEHGNHQKGYDKDHYVIYDEYRLHGEVLHKYKLISYTSDDVKSADQALAKFYVEVCHGQSRFAIKEFQERCDRIYDLYHKSDIDHIKDNKETDCIERRSQRSRLTGSKNLVDPLRIGEIYDEIEEAARVYTSYLNRNDVLTYTEADWLFTSCIEHFNDNADLVNMIDSAANAKTIDDQVFMLDAIDDEIRNHIDTYLKERDKSPDRSLECI